MDDLERIIPETIFCKGFYSPVLAVKTHPAGNHPEACPIIKTLTAVEIVTARGSRWYGFERAWIGSDLRMHVAPINPRDEVVRAWKGPGE